MKSVTSEVYSSSLLRSRIDQQCHGFHTVLYVYPVFPNKHLRQ